MPKGTAIQVNDPTDTGTLFALKMNVIRDSGGKIISGLSIGPVTEQNQALLLLLSPGESKEYPTAGVDIEQQILDDDLLAIRHSIRRNFALDGLQIIKLELYDTSRVQIQSKY